MWSLLKILSILQIATVFTELLMFITVTAADDLYEKKTGRTRDELLSSGDYIPVSVFGNADRQSKETASLETYLPIAARRPGEKQSNMQFPIWPKTFRKHLDLVKPKSANYGVKFLLFTARSNPDKQEFISDKTHSTILSTTTWRPSEKIKVLIHGYKQKASNPKMPQAQKDAYLETNSTANIVIVDWESLANNTNYFESAMNSYKVGIRLGEFLVGLKNRGLISSYDNVHLIGYCLGAHVAGVAGNFVQKYGGGQKLIRRITGLDPAGPGFHWTKPEIRLDRTDAAFVDVIHTNMGADFKQGQLGISNECGHANFYPNGGLYQPVCKDIHAIGNLISKCSHKKAADYYTRSITGEIFRGCPCPNWGALLNGHCKCPVGRFMGEYLPPDVKGSLFLHVFEYSLMEIFQQMGIMPSD